MSALILSTDAAAGLRRPHADLSAALDRARSMLPPDLADALMEPVDLMGWLGPGLPPAARGIGFPVHRPGSPA
jgi:hypothetical protein